MTTMTPMSVETEAPSMGSAAVAERLRVSDRTLRRLAKQRVISHHLVGKQLRFAPGDVEAYLRKTRVNAV
jgi:excisionase family DNA binding protein